MRKISLILGLALVLAGLLINPVTAGYSYNYPQRYYSYPSYENYKSASYSDTPVISDKIKDASDKSSFYNREYQGPVMQKDTRYDEFLKVGKSGRVTRTVSYQTSERYVGNIEREAKGESESKLYERDYSSVPTRSSYSQESSFRDAHVYNSYDYGNGYGNNYYYSPKYSNGYYNWRY